MRQKKTMNRILSTILALAMVLTCSMTALATGDTGVSVVLDGKPVSFTDAAPCVKDGRTMLPFRAVFEAMGATVDYDTATSTVIATLNGKTLHMVVGSTEATITEDGVTTTMSMDVAPYVDSTTDRTYVPVRFAAEAFGCNVGWDQDSQSVIIVDVAKLVSETLSNYQYTTLQKYLDYTAAIDAADWSTTGTMAMEAMVMGKSMISVDSDFSGVSAGQSAAQMLFSMSMDMTGMIDMIAQMQGATAEDLGYTADMTKMDMDMDIRVDMETGTIYFLLNDEMNAQLGLPAGTWCSMNMNDYTSDVTGELAGLDLTTELTAAKDFNLADLLSLALSQVSLDGKVDTAYQELSTELTQLAAAFSDTGFTKTDAGYETTFKMEDNGTTASFKFALTTDTTGAVTGYSLTGDAAIPSDFIADLLGEELVSSLSMVGGLPKTITLNMAITQSDSGAATIDLAVNLGTLASLTMDMDLQNTPATTAPVTTPPDGATVIPYADLMNAQGA